MNVTPPNSAVQSKAWGKGRRRGPPALVALAIIAWPARPKRPLPIA